MTTEALALADFLLARIAEDEAALRGPEVSIMSGGRPRSFDALPRPRLLAECESKRRIVAYASALQADVERLAPPSEHIKVVAKDRLLALLALPYADHPDYRQEWKP